MFPLTIHHLLHSVSPPPSSAPPEHRGEFAASLPPTADHFYGAPYGPPMDPLWGPQWTPGGPPRTMDPLWTHYGPTMDPLWTHYGPTKDPIWTHYAPTMTHYGPTMDPLRIHYGLRMHIRFLCLLDISVLSICLRSVCLCLSVRLRSVSAIGCEQGVHRGPYRVHTRQGS